MRKAVFLDTSVLCELLRVPGKCQRPDEVRVDVTRRVDAGETLLLPTAAIIETGNHIAQLADGHARRRCAHGLVNVLQATAQQDPPWVLNGARWDVELIGALCNGARGCPPLPDMASQRVGAGDVSILAEAEAYERRAAHVAVEIWTFDQGLGAYA
ncbi:MAG: hypothetical protein MSC31_12300 [Solirubrobacteraceae bacterium MAG38_C4-C5]|nr:hypothetical protein [Candidatus Siliceabacter maunaloa]